MTTSTDLASLATPADLARRLKATPPADDLGNDAWLAALEDASAEVRSAIGQPISRMTVTLPVTLDEAGEWVCPIVPLIDVTAVTFNGITLSSGLWIKYQQGLHFPARYASRSGLLVTVVAGYEDVPAELIRWTCLLAAAQLAAVDAQGNLGMGAVTSIRVDDGQVNFRADQGVAEIPEQAAARLRAKYGAST